MTAASLTQSPAERLVAQLVGALGPGAHGAVDLALAQLTPVERAGLAYAWRDFWARPKQVVPAGNWRSFGILSGRGFGKTRALAEWVTGEIMAGRAGRVAICAPTDDDTRDIMVEGETGLLAVAPPWFRPDFQPTNGFIEYPNGARVFLYSATAPEHFRGPQHHVFWGEELGAWPQTSWEAAWYNMRFGLRLGQARLVWATTPRSVPLVRALVERHKAHPAKHLIVRGSTFENRANLPQHALDEWMAEYGGTRLGLQELEGELLEDDANEPFTPAMVADAKARAPGDYLCRAIAIDPAITSRAGSDMTGISWGGLGLDDVVYVLGDLSGKYPASTWAQIVIDLATRLELGPGDAIVYESNRGGELVPTTLRALERALRAEGRLRRPLPPLIEVRAKKDKRSRAWPVATRYERGRVKHASGADLARLEKSMLARNWDAKSPDPVDAMVHLVWHLAKLSDTSGPPDDYAGATAPGRGVSRPTGARFDDDDTGEDSAEREDMGRDDRW